MQKRIKDTIQRWERFMNGVEYNKEKIRCFLPNPFFVGESEWQTEMAANKLCELLHCNNVMQFRDDTQLLYYRVSYNSEEMLCFREIKTLTQLLEYHFRGKYKGVLVLDLTEWLEHSKEVYFGVLMNYLAEQREDIFVFFHARTKKLEKIEDMVSQMRKYFHLDIFDFTEENRDVYVEYAKSIFKEQGRFVRKSAEKELENCIERLMRTRGFGGFESVKYMTEEIVFELAVKGSKERGITEEVLKEFSGKGIFWKDVKEEKTQKIGFQIRE